MPSQQQGYQRYTVAIETLANNYSALEAYLQDTYGNTRLLENVPEIGTLLKSLPPSERVPIELISVGVTALAAQLEEPNLGLKIVPYLGDTHQRMVLFMRSASLNLIDFLKMISRYSRISSDLFDYEIIETKSEIIFRLNPVSPETISHHQYEAVTGIIANSIQRNNNIAINKLDFTHSKPSGNSDIYRKFYGLEPKFEQETATIHFPIQCRNMVIPGNDDGVECIKSLQNYESQYSKFPEQESMSERCLFLIPFLLCVGEANKNRLAEVICVSPRTLQRKLNEEGTSFRDLLQ
ncbi:MAG: AraC family transcriptional regulator, partial [Pseudomonadales bacterium]|nr:AraC family transcriptional regulator [Pseudomonadales bacterium]